MKVTSKKSIDFPKFGWGITKGDVRDLPEDMEAREAILAHPAIEAVDAPKSSTPKSGGNISK